MAERTDEPTRSGVEEYEDLLDDGPTTSRGGREMAAGESSTTAEPSGSRFGSRLRTPSLSSFLLTLALVVVGMVGTGTLVPFVPFTGLLGVFAAGFGLGALSDRQRYVSLAVAGALAVGVGTLFDYLVISLLGVGLPLVAVGAGAGAVAAVLGHYFGRDLRDGLTEEL
ncbi:hypothetical protein VB773_07885 [Haloarculaceae archaeon H-GB2-1]|nr:hypothetical protein [Haloarculaceae archaeon H-GB1-1]MEA5385988.1 hypothetical protein [Haloarculaceae archaeon H-GB11]MEA5407494.1 hypothetical protein [Haloarculaceae archaeon H-GB2-1]